MHVFDVLTTLSCLFQCKSLPDEPPHEKTNNVVFEKVWHKLSCTSTEDG